MTAKKGVLGDTQRVAEMKSTILQMTAPPDAPILFLPIVQAWLAVLLIGRLPTSMQNATFRRMKNARKKERNFLWSRALWGREFGWDDVFLYVLRDVCERPARLAKLLKTVSRNNPEISELVPLQIRNNRADHAPSGQYLSERLKQTAKKLRSLGVISLGVIEKDHDGLRAGQILVSSKKRKGMLLIPVRLIEISNYEEHDTQKDGLRGRWQRDIVTGRETYKMGDSIFLPDHMDILNFISKNPDKFSR